MVLGQNNGVQAGGRPLIDVETSRLLSSSISEPISYVFIDSRLSVLRLMTRVHFSGMLLRLRFVYVSCSSSLSSSLMESSESECNPSSFSSSRMYCYILLVRTFWFLLISVIININPPPNFIRCHQCIQRNFIPARWITRVLYVIFNQAYSILVVKDSVAWNKVLIIDLKSSIWACHYIFNLTFNQI